MRHIREHIAPHNVHIREHIYQDGGISHNEVRLPRICWTYINSKQLYIKKQRLLGVSPEPPMTTPAIQSSPALETARTRKYTYTKHTWIQPRRIEGTYTSSWNGWEQIIRNIPVKRSTGHSSSPTGNGPCEEVRHLPCIEGTSDVTKRWQRREGVGESSAGGAC